MWPFQPELTNEVFEDDLDAGQGVPAKASPRQEYMNLAAVPRFSRPSMELQVAPTRLGAARPCRPSGLCAWLEQWWWEAALIIVVASLFWVLLADWFFFLLNELRLPLLVVLEQFNFLSSQ